MSHFFRFLATALTALLLVVAVQAAARQPLPADRIVAIVNSDAITLNELRSRIAMIERQLTAQKVALPPPEVMEKQLLERMIIDKAQMQYAKEIGQAVGDLELDAALRRIAENNRLSMSEFQNALKQDNIPWDKFREEIRQEMTISRLRDREVDARISISEGEIDNYLENAERNGGEDEVVQLAHLIVRVPEKAEPAQLERIRGKIEQAVLQLRRGADFAQVAAAVSDAPDAMNGGLMEPRPLGRLPNLYAEEAKKLQPGAISPILRSPAGFHVIKLIERHGGMAPTQALKQTHARHILIKVNELVSDSEARRRLVALKERLEHGGDFAELARLHSNDLSAGKGGDLGWLYQGDTVPDFERAMDNLKIDEISEPVRSPFGWHLIQVLERRTEDASTERRRQMARRALRDRKADEAYQDWLRQLRDRTYVEYRLEEK